MIRLAEFIIKSLDEVRPLTQKDLWVALFKRNRDEGGPARMGAKSKSDLPHTTPPELSKYVANVTRSAHISKGRMSSE